MQDGLVVPLGPENVVLRGSSLKNTDYVVGIAVFTGHDTKVMMNSMKAKYKFSRLELLVNKAILIVLAFQVVFAIIGASCGVAWALYNTDIEPATARDCHDNYTKYCIKAYYMEKSQRERKWGPVT